MLFFYYSSLSQLLFEKIFLLVLLSSEIIFISDLFKANVSLKNYKINIDNIGWFWIIDAK